ncbi:MAG: DUF1993 domain-containing protein [Minisyncoccia bacterium]
MQTSLYSVTIPMFQNALKALSGVLDKAVAHAAEKGVDPDTYLTKQLAPDQFPFVKQIQIACDHLKAFPFRMKGEEVPSVPDTETTIAELKMRIAHTLKILEEVKPEDINANEDQKIRFSYFPGKHLTGYGYTTGYLIPNFFFHMTTAYSILRHEGVPLGKADYIGMLPLNDD